MKRKLFFLILVLLFLGIILGSSRMASGVVAQAQCVAIAGDSVANGDVEYMTAPGSGVFKTLTPASWGSLSNYVNGGQNFAVPAVTVSSFNDQALINSNCQYFVLGPWVNDLGQNEAGPTIAGISRIVNDIKSKKPSAKIFVVNYYTPQPASWTSTIWPKGFAGSRINAFNSLIQSTFGSSVINVGGFGTSDLATTYEGHEADGVHLSKSGLQHLAGLINSAVGSSTSSSPSSPSSPQQPVSSGPAVNGDRVGPELADPAAGTNVVEKNGFTGTAAVINNLRDVNHPDTPHNTAPHAKVVLRVDVDALTALTPSVAVDYANQLNASNEFAPGTIVVLGVELNNLDQQGWNGARSSDTEGDLVMAAHSYAQLFNAFSAAIRHDKYKVAPAPPDLYNGKYTPATWVTSFAASVRCNLVDVLAADVFDVRPAPSVGGGNLDTWQYLEKNICGGTKKVAHFEGWGSDPRASIQDQINFLRTQQLPKSDLTATSLIANNCTGFGGNEKGTVEPNTPWLYWIPKFPDKVFKADGSEFNYFNCTSGATPKPYPLKDVPCRDTVDPEFHSLRPYPASPCNKKVQDTALFCGNDLIVKTTFNVTPNNNCTGSPDDFTCTYDMPGQQSNISINLKGAQLPILGNTELVPNATWGGPNIGATNLKADQRMNEYVSWYLNGVIDRAEEDYSANDPKNLVNFSGPLRKLLPWTIQSVARIHSVEDAVTSLSSTQPKDDVRHNQIAGCLLTALGSGVLPAPCYWDISQIVQFANQYLDITQILQKRRLAQWQDQPPPLETDPKYKSFAEYWRAYQQWRGNICITSPVAILGQNYYVCLTPPGSAPIWSILFNHVPFSSTEDRKGEVVTDDNKVNPNGTRELANTIQLKDGQGNGGTVSNVYFTTETSKSHGLYFAHTEEVAQLGQLLQNTYAAKSTGANNWEDVLSRDVAIHDPDVEGGMPKFNTYGCNKTEVRTNPGDNLYGEIDRGGDQQISGTLKYDAKFTCEFKKQTDQQCVSKCAPNDQTCISKCSSVNTCNKDIYTSLAIYTKTPKIQEIWDRLVDGSMSVFKRIFPKVGPGAPIEVIKDIPASTKVAYAASNNEAKAGMTGKSGSEAEIYFPHVGGLQEYFLKGIQTALRPKGFSEVALAGQPLPPQTNQTIETISCPGPKSLPSPPSDSVNKCQVPPACSSVTDNDIPQQYLILKDDTKRYALALAGRGKNLVDECFDYVVKRSLDAGINPVYTLSIWVQESAASNYERFGCSLQDMGVNNKRIAADLDAQLTAFLRLPYLYPNSTAPQCFTGGCSIEAFSLVYQQGAPSGGACVPNASAIDYANKTRNTASQIAPNCDFPKYPTEATSCH